MSIPKLLAPNSFEEITLPSGEKVQIPKTTPLFTAWSGAQVDSSYNSKPILAYKDRPVFAELAILRLFEDAGWRGVWVDTYGKKYRSEYWPKNEVSLPAEQQKLLQDISNRAGSKNGCFDVFCWRDDSIIFAESKRKAKDRIRDTQRRWLQAALQCGLQISSFLIVEWSVEK